MLEETEYTAKPMLRLGRFKSAKDSYNERGYLVKRIRYNHRSNPREIAVYGYIDGARVSKSANVQYADDPPAGPARMPPSGVAPPPRDERYTAKYVYSYDDKKRLKESLSYGNDGSGPYRKTYTYIGNKIEIRSVYGSGNHGEKETLTLDNDGNVAEKTLTRDDTRYPGGKTVYKYEAFDKQGNWIKRAVTGNSPNYDGTVSAFSVVEYRMITYYP